MSKPRLYEIQLLTGIAIFFVVAGHLASRGALEIPHYVAFKKVVYKFHMPLFMFLSGFVAFYTYRPIRNLADYWKFIKKKMFRLLPAYIIMSLVFIFGKGLINDTFEIKDSFLNMLFYPSLSDSGYLWYIYVLFIFYLALPVLMFFKEKLIFFLPFFFAISFMKFPMFIALQSFFWYLPFFILGGVVCLNYNSFINVLRKTGLSFFGLFVLWVLLELVGLLSIPKQISGIIAIVGLFFLVYFIVKRQSIFEYFGVKSFYIYLFNTMFIGAFNFFIMKFFGKKIYYEYFYFLMPFLIVFGLYLPIFLHKYLITKVPFLKNWIR